jgi:hypothetical protein
MNIPNIPTTLAHGADSLIFGLSATCKRDVLMQETIIFVGLNLEIYYKTSLQNIYFQNMVSQLNLDSDRSNVIPKKNTM